MGGFVGLLVGLSTKNVEKLKNEVSWLMGPVVYFCTSRTCYLQSDNFWLPVPNLSRAHGFETFLTLIVLSDNWVASKRRRKGFDKSDNFDTVKY